MVGITGQSLPDLGWWHGESFKTGHDSFCTMNTGAARGFCQNWALASGGRQKRAAWVYQVRQFRTKRKMSTNQWGLECLIDQTTAMKREFPGSVRDAV
jgi:hypothetical protein